MKCYLISVPDKLVRTIHFLLSYAVIIFSGKSLIGKEKAIQTAEKESNDEDTGMKLKADPVFFISLTGLDKGRRGLVDEYEHIFDIFTKEYDFLGSDVKVISAQDLWDFYEKCHDGADEKMINIYRLAEFFVEKHCNGHFVFDECPFISDGELNIFDTQLDLQGR